jgi:hypothetical protein
MPTIKHLSAAALAALAMLSWGCHPDTIYRVIDADGSGGPASGNDARGSAPDASAGDRGAPAPDAEQGLVVRAPFAVDDYYLASGYMGDGETGGIVEMPCPTRAGEMRGACHLFQWTPGAKGWAGVYWQYPLDNWGTLPGLGIAPGATAIRFWAWGEAGQEKVSFVAGYRASDGFAVEAKDVVLTATPTMLTIDLADQAISRVAAGFGWVSATSNMKPVRFFIDDIQWR